MSDTKKKIIGIGVSAVLVSFITVFGTEFLLNTENGIEIPGLSGRSGKEQIENIEYLNFYRINEKGEILEEKLNVKNSHDIRSYFEYIFKSYGAYAENEIINIPADVKVLDYKTQMGTLYINLSKEILESNMGSRIIEQTFYETMGKSLYPYSRKYGFQDFQILVEGESEARIFGFMETSHPKIVIP